ncbi:replication protein A 70 kDa DNA-binding subunit D-like isoform X2 [Primulina eburnea]
MVNEKPIIAFSNMKIQPYQDTVQLKSTYTTTIFLNPPCTESKKLNIWLNSGFKDHNLNDLWLATKLKCSKEITINQLLNERKSLTENTYYSFKGYVLEVENRLNPWYEACNNCSRAIIKTKDATSCTKCVHIHVEAVPRYRVTINVKKDNDNVKITLFEDVATAFIGCSVKDYIKSVAEDASASPYYMALEIPEKEEYISLFKFAEKTLTNNATYSITVEGFKKSLQKQESGNFKDVNANAEIQIEDDEKIATFIKRKNIKHNPMSKTRSQQNNKKLADDAKRSTHILIEDDDKLSSSTKRKRQVKTKNATQNVESLKIKQEKV